MKPCLFLLSLFVVTASLSAQDNGNFGDVDRKALEIPLAETYSTTGIAGFITSNFNTDKEILRAIYTWVTANIRYDADSMYIINSEKDPEARIREALRRRKGVCENYAAIFNDIAVKCKLASYLVSGYTRQLGNIDRAGHTWIAVYLDKEWSFCDPTWDEGNRGGSRWFLVQPSRFIESHMPFDPLWQLLEYHVSHKDFYKGNFFPKKEKPAYNFPDSVNQYLRLNQLQQLEAAAARIEKAGLANQLIINQLAFIRMQAAIIYEERDMKCYNAAVNDFNNANTILNHFIQYRNNGFNPEKPDLVISSMLNPIDSILETAYKKIDTLAASATNLQYDPGLLKNRFVQLEEKLKEQKVFVKKWLATAPALRNTLFYK